MTKYLFPLLFLLSGCATVETKELSIEYGKYLSPDQVFIAEMPNDKPKESLALNMNLEYSDFFWDNQVHATTSDAQYRLIGWELKVGVKPTDWMDVGYHHHSQHLLDTVDPYRHFPVEDQVFVKFYLIKGK